jgi:galactofuranose transport system ATP-binding protein
VQEEKRRLKSAASRIKCHKVAFAEREIPVMTDGSVILQMKGINKSFPGVRALSNVDFSLRPGEVHALMGENGAGKSTLIKVLTGVERQESGEITLNGKSYQAKSPQHAQQMGISTVYQEVNLCPNLSVAENIFIGREPMRFGMINSKEINRQAAKLLERMNIYLNVTKTLSSYSVAIQQMVAIARALNTEATRVLILDEPTSSLDIHEVRKLFEVMRQLRDEGLGIIFITHFIDQVYEISNRITVLRQGELVGTYDTASLPRLQLVSKMIGKELDDLESLSKIKEKAGNKDRSHVLLKTKKLGLKGSVQPFDVELCEGEVMGFAGLLGSGRSEAARILFGVDTPDTGTLEMDKKEFKHFSPFQSILKGIGLCPENRKNEGVIGELTVRENIVLALQASKGWFKFIPLKQQYEIADQYIKSLHISTPSADQLMKNLSGGNQQKAILARWLAINPRLLILDEPTRGIDIGTKAEIQKLILELAEEGKSVVFISSELDEVIRCSHRVMVMRDRQKVAELEGDQIDENEIMHTIAGAA